MHTRLLHHIRHNVVAYIALFVALGGSSYAVVNLPANSVGPRQLRNHTITPVKLDPKSIAGSVRAWAIVYGDTTAVTAGPASSAVRVQSIPTGDQITWLHHRFASNCLVSATPIGAVTNGGYGSVSTQFDAHAGSLILRGFDRTTSGHPQPAYVLIICP